MNKYRFFSSEAVLHILAWLFIFSMPLIFHHGQQQVSMRDYFLGLFMSLMLFVTFYTNYFVLAPCLFMKGRKKAFFILEIILLIVVVIIVQEVFTSYAPPIRHAGGLHHMHAGPARWMFVIRDFVTLSLSAAIGVAIRLSSSWHKAEDARKEAEIGKREAELKNLRNQINPHFLLNTLNNIYALTMFDTAKAQQAIQELSKLLRYLLYDNQKPLTSLKEETGFIESYIDARLLPSMHRYRMMFRRLPFDLKIMNDGGLVIYQTDISRPLDNTTLWRLATRTSETVGAHVVTSDDGAIAPSYYSESIPDAVFKLYALDAGVALLTEDASEINQLQQRLEDRRAQLTSQNAILRRNHAMQSLLFRQRRERELGERVERDLASTAAQISRILDNRIVGDSPYARAERIQQLNLVKVLVAYSKRKGMLALAAAEYEALTSEQLELVAREAMADLNSIGIECAVLVESGSTIPIAAFNTIYDCFYDCVIGVLPFTDPVIMTYITTHGDTIEMRANIECAIGLTGGNDVEMIPQIATSTEPWTAVQLEIARNLEGRLATRGGDYSVLLDEGLVNVTVRAAAPTPSRKPKPGAEKAPASTPEDGPEGADEEVSG